MFKQVFASPDDLLKWARMISNSSGFVIVIIRSDTANDNEEGRQMFFWVARDEVNTCNIRRI